MGDSDREALRRLLRRVERIDFQPSAEERRVLSDCENRVLLWAGAAGLSASLAGALALRRVPFPGPMSRLLATSLPGVLSAHTALGWAGERCLCDLVAISETSPLGGEAVRVLHEFNPTSQILKDAPKAARWAPDSLPRLPEAHTGSAIAERLAAVPPKPAQTEAEADVLSEMLGGAAPKTRGAAPKDGW